MSLRTFLILLCCHLAACLPRAAAAEGARPAANAGLVLASTNGQMLAEMIHKPSSSLVFDPDDGLIARLVAEMLVKQHYLGLPLSDGVSSKFLDRYLETLDGLHLHFFQSDLAEFEMFRFTLDNLTLKRESDISPARVIFKRFLERLDQRINYVHELLEKETFTFDGEDTYDTNRKEAPRPKNMEEARKLWRQHLRYEILSEKLAKEKPAEIAGKINRRYTRLMRTFKEFDGQDVFEIYLSSLARVYDPHSEYMGKSTYDNFNVGMALSLFGIGALLESEDGYCKIKSLVPGGPADRSKKLKEKDRIIAVAQAEGEPVDVVDTKLSKIVELIRGPKNTEVRLTVIPADAPDSSARKVVSIVRDEIKLEDQEAKAKIIDLPADGGKTVRLGWIDLPSFYANFDEKRPEKERKSTTADVKKLLGKLIEEKAEGVVLDLRRNGGGSLEEAINLTGLFIKEGPVVQVRDPDGKIGVDEDPDPTMLYGGPLIVLTSRFSASASEILAGALQDYGRALIVGDSSTHGKGTVQTLADLKRYMRSFSKSTNSPGAVKLTIRKFYRAAGSSTQLKGVTPDIVLPSVNNYAEVGESSLQNPLEWDTIKSAEFTPFNFIPPILPELKKRSEARVATDRDYDYIREDIALYRKAIADKKVSLNEARRLKERDENEVRRKARQAELKQRKEPEEKVYEITLKLAELPGLPPPMAKTNTVAKAAGADPHSKAEKPAAPKDPDADEDEDESDTKVPRVDAHMNEARRILVDMIRLWPSSAAVAATAPVPPATRNVQ